MKSLSTVGMATARNERSRKSRGSRVLACGFAIVASAAVHLPTTVLRAEVPKGLPTFEDQDALDDRDKVIQNRKYDLTHEASLLFGGIPVDPYYKGVTATAIYTLHFSDFWAWEVVNGTYSFNFETSLQDEVKRVAFVTGQQVPTFPEINWFASSRLVLKPLYGKQAIFNTEVVHIEGYLALGPAAVGRADGAAPIAFGGDFGAGIRFWFFDSVAVRVDLGQLVYLEGTNIEQDLHLHLGFSFDLEGEE